MGQYLNIKIQVGAISVVYGSDYCQGPSKIGQEPHLAIPASLALSWIVYLPLPSSTDKILP
jgi:hypothetical protein